MPDFRGLVIKAYKALDSAVYSVISGDGPGYSNLNAVQKAERKRFKKGEYDVVLGMLERRLEGEASNRNPVRQEVGSILRPKNKPAPIHQTLMRLADRGGAVTIITTNFDLLLKNAARNMKSPVQTYALGGIPRPTLRQEFNGVHTRGLGPQPRANV